MVEIGAVLTALVWWEVILGAVLFAAFFWGLYEESGVFSFIALVIFLSISWTGIGALGAYLSTLSWTTIAAAVGIYIGLGIIWSAWKWRGFVKNQKANYIKYITDRGDEYNVEHLRIQIGNRKDNDTIAFWIILWPMSAIAYVFTTFIFDFIAGIVERMTTVYDKITNSIISKV